jgi:uncharacterized phosphosugar-binding protein
MTRTDEEQSMLGKGKEYLGCIQTLLSKIQEVQAGNIARAAEMICQAVVDGQALFGFGTVHSALPVSDLYIRAGGLALLNQIKAPALNSVAYEPPMLAMAMERLEGYGSLILKHAHTRPGDVLILVSVSGRNPVPVEMALSAKQRGMKVIALTSLEYSQSVTSRHSSGKKLYEIGDVVIDCYSVPGDAILEHEKIPVKFCPTSGVVNTAILQCLIAETIERLVKRGFDPPVFIAGNLDGFLDYKRKFRRKLVENKERIFYTLFEDVY